MILPLLLLLQVPAQPQAVAPRREITDPGTIATNQRVTPAGVQSVFTDRVSACDSAGPVRSGCPSTARPTGSAGVTTPCWAARRSTAAPACRGLRSIP